MVRLLPPSLCDAQKGRCASLLRERCINGLFKVIEHTQGFRVREWQELHENHPGYAFRRIDPKIRVPKTCPGETAGTPSTRHGLGRDHKSGAPFLGHAGEEFGVM